ncbi:tRNA dihydrouridine(20/20a) synthase DusA [Candidatus Njordibacter sp. Uisw_039]|uniref:tRNA dihydrouridine(20/20a) synthase DusA n=1 Tax=Candidatus Njordibacter sp. Uisw_039 TaxID=3230972 RepID=UPI003D5078D3
MSTKPMPSNELKPRLDHRFSVAPMIDVTDRHYRYLARLLSQHALLYTEMITTGAILNGDQDYLLSYTDQEHPLALQLGGSNVGQLAQCARIGESYGYDEINLNVGCPSDKVQNNMIGACLMGHPKLVTECMQAMIEAVTIPVTIKHRIGIDDIDNYDVLAEFVEQVSGSGCDTFIVHARNAILKGLSPKQNREIPPLQYDKVYRLKADFPDLEIIINGGINNLADCHQHLTQVDGVMLGRAANHNSALLTQVDQQFFGCNLPMPERHQAALTYFAYMQQQHEKGTSLHHMSGHIMGLFQGIPGARALRRHISDNIHGSNANIQVMYDALTLIQTVPTPITETTNQQ